MKNKIKIILIGMIMLVTSVLISFIVSAVTYPACCCLESEVYVVAGDNSYSKCYFDGGDITEGDAGSQEECMATCGVSICDTCKTGSCSDYNYCADDSEGGACPTGQICCSGACTLSSAPGEGCESPTLAIKPVNVVRGNDRGYERVTLTWDNNFECAATDYEILRCSAEDCVPSSSIGTTAETSFVDTSISWGITYRYIIRGNYPHQGQKDSSTAEFYSGDPECEGQYTEATFCVDNAYYFCSIANWLSGETQCASGKVCAGGICIEPSECDLEEEGPYGMYYTQEACEGTDSNPKYCFYDRSSTNVDNCYACGDDTMKCYDYKSAATCARDNCGVGLEQSCQWVSISDELGTGVCIDALDDNCAFCKEKGTPSMENVNFDAYNEIFDAYSSDKLDALSTELFPCFESANTCTSCGDKGCSIYTTQAACSVLGATPVTLGETNALVTSSADSCHINVCTWDDGVCKKDADGIPQVDCKNAANPDDCEKDYFRPNTTMTFIEDNEGTISGFTITIIDKDKVSDTYVVKTSTDYKTYYCIQSPTSSCIPRTTGHGFLETNARTLAVGEYELDLRVCDGVCDENSPILDGGMNTLKYYSEDPSKNLGYVQELQFLASPEFRPTPYAYYIVEANLVDEIYYTADTTPTIQVNFSNPAKLVSYTLNKAEGDPISLPNLGDELKLAHSLVPLEQLDDGIYRFRFNAENEYERNLVNDRDLAFVVNTIVPTIEIYPDDITLNSSTVDLLIIFNQKALLNEVYLDGVDITEGFVTEDNYEFKVQVFLGDGIHTISVADAESYSGIHVNKSTTFEINTLSELNIDLIYPSYGASPTHTFNITLGTDNTAECRYTLDIDEDDFNHMSPFDDSDSTTHFIEEFSIIDEEEHKLYVKCKDAYYDEITSKIFDLAVDTSPPVFVPFTGADPDLVATFPPFTKLKVTTDDETVCGYGPAVGESHNFSSWDTMTFSDKHTQEIFPPSVDASYVYSIWCMNKAELQSSTTIEFEVSVDAALDIDDKTADTFPNKTIDLRVGVNFDTDCRFSKDADASISSWLYFGKEDTLNHKSTIRVSGDGTHTYYVKCYDSRIPGWVGDMGSTSPFAITFAVDTSPPIMIYVNDSSNEPNPEVTWRTNQLRVKWLGEDKETRVSRYHYRLREFGSTQRLVFNWTTSSDEEEWLVVDKNLEGEQLNLTDKKKYQFDVFAENAYGLTGKDMSSDGITVDSGSKPETCSNGIKDGLETDIDCGDGCDGCNASQTCKEKTDCMSGLFCNATKQCDYPSCTDGVKNGDESDIDCGGSCNKCGNDKSCNGRDSNCASGYCNPSTGTCTPPDKCHNGVLDSGETDIDCGGPCSGCSSGGYCDIDDDCDSGQQCIQGQCRADSDGDGKMDADDNCPSVANADQKDTDQDGEGDACDDDIDGDGLKNVFENKYNLDQLNMDSDGDGTFDGSEDEDNEGLTTQEEHDYGFNYCLDPWKKDTDGDGHSDKTELEKGTDPCDANSKPGVSWWMFWLLLLLIILVILAYIFYPKYKDYIEKYVKKKEVKKETIKPLAKPMQPMVGQPIRRPMPIRKHIAVKPRPAEDRLKELIEKRKKIKSEKRQGLFSTFGEEEKPSEKKKQEIKPKETKPTEKKEESPKKAEEDIFSQLKEIKKGQKDMMAKQSKDKKEVFKKLEKVKKGKKIVAPIVVVKGAKKKPIPVVSTKTSKVYHKKKCITVKGKSNLVNYKTESEAKKKGLHSCKVCFPEKNKKR